MKEFQLTRRAIADLQSIRDFVSDDSLDAADRLIAEFEQVFQKLAEIPGIGP